MLTKNNRTTVFKIQLGTTIFLLTLISLATHEIVAKNPSEEIIIFGDTIQIKMNVEDLSMEYPFSDTFGIFLIHASFLF